MSQKQSVLLGLIALSGISRLAGGFAGAQLYVTEDSRADIEADGYFDNNIEHIKPGVVMFAQTEAGTAKPEISVYSVTVTQTPAKPATAKKKAVPPGPKKVKLIPMAAPAPSVDVSLVTRLEALETKITEVSALVAPVE